jgi:hypothetical protein
MSVGFMPDRRGGFASVPSAETKLIYLCISTEMSASGAYSAPALQTSIRFPVRILRRAIRGAIY